LLCVLPLKAIDEDDLNDFVAACYTSACVSVCLRLISLLLEHQLLSLRPAVVFARPHVLAKNSSRCVSVHFLARHHHRHSRSHTTELILNEQIVDVVWVTQMCLYVASRPFSGSRMFSYLINANPTPPPSPLHRQMLHQRQQQLVHVGESQDKMTLADDAAVCCWFLE
jgi:hypothetical protein